MELTIMTLNLGGTEDGWFEGRRQVLVAGMLEARPALLCLQEVSSRGSPYPYDQVKDLSERCELPYACFAPYGNPDEIRSRVRGGIALISRWPFRMVETLQLPPGSSGSDARVALLGTLIAPEGELHAVCTHLSWPHEARETRMAQIEHLLARMTDLWLEDPDCRVALGGDLNAVEDEPGMRRLEERMADAYRIVHPGEAGLTWTHANPLVWYPSPDRRLDYLWVDRRAEVVRAEAVFTDPRRPASDHYGVLGRIRWPAS